MPVEIDVAKVARLARLAIPTDAMDDYRRQCEDILDHAARVQALPTDGVAPTSHPLPMTNAFRDDVVTECLDRENVLAQAPERDGDYFLVPRILDEQ